MKLDYLIQKDNNNIDLIRLIAASMVVWAHAFALSAGRLGDDFIGKMIPCCDAGGMGVHVFFFFSGLLVTTSMLRTKSPIRFVSSRFFRIFPAFFVLLLVLVFLVGPLYTTLGLREYFSAKDTWAFLFHNSYFNIQFDLPGVWQDHLYHQMDGATWTLPLEIGCYIAVLVSFVICNRTQLPAWVPMLLFLVVSFFSNQELAQILGINYTEISHQLMFCFVVGSACAVFKDKINIDKTLVLALLVFCMFTWRYSHVILFVFSIAFSLLLFYATSVRPLLRLRPKHDISYGIYIWHWPLMQMWLEHTGWHNPYLIFGVTYLSTLLVAYASCRLVEEPCMSLGKRVGTRLSARLSGREMNGILVIAIFVVGIAIAKVFL